MSDRQSCPMCRRPLPAAGKGYWVGVPTKFLICRDCWKGFVVPMVSNSRKLWHLLGDVVDLRDL